MWLAGTLAALELGAVAPVGSAVRAALGVSLGAVALATSGMTAVGAVFGIPVGRRLRAADARDALVLGLLVIAAASLAGACCGDWPVLLGSRVAAGGGYLLVLVAGPTALARLYRGRVRAVALAAWGSCVPAGLALAGAAGGAFATAPAWSDWLAVTAAGPLAAAVLLRALLPPVPGSPAARAAPAAGTAARAAAPAGAYACLSLISVAVLVLLPAFLTGPRHVGGPAAGSATAAVSFCGALGGFAAGRLLHRGIRLRTLVPAAVLMPLGCLPAFSPGLPPAAGVGAAAVVLFVDGLLIAAVFAAVPAVTRRGDDVDVLNGALAQFGSLGILLGPPLYGLAVDHTGWRSTAVATALVTVPTAGFLLRTARAAGTADGEPRPDPGRPAPGAAEERTGGREDGGRRTGSRGPRADRAAGPAPKSSPGSGAGSGPGNSPGSGPGSGGRDCRRTE